MPEYTQIDLANGQSLTVEGELDTVGMSLERSGSPSGAKFAWFTEQAMGDKVAVNPGHVVSIKRSPISGD